MYLELIIDRVLVKRWHLDEERLFKKKPEESFRTYMERAERIIALECEEIRLAYTDEIERCAIDWSIQLRIRSKRKSNNVKKFDNETDSSRINNEYCGNEDSLS